MKLLLCTRCGDVFKLRRYWKCCECGEVSGQYLDNVNAEVNGEGVSLAIGNGSLANAVRKVRDGSERADVICWARQHEGEGNPNTILTPEGARR
jgi:predicted  nucleic acid-binding Zn-ribbon protein